MKQFALNLTCCSILVAFCYINPTVVNAKTLRVPAAYETIQAGIDAAEDGDTVLVADGVYFGEGNRDINFKGKAITVKSENGPEATIIAPQGNNGFTFDQGETETSVLRGFTVRNGDNGIWCNSAAPMITDCILIQNGQYGIVCHGNASPTITDCILTQNRVDGINCRTNASPTIRGCTIAQNVSIGVRCLENARPTITNCSITENGNMGIFASTGLTMVSNCIVMRNDNDGIHCNGGSPVIINCVIAENKGIGISDQGSGTILNTIVWGNGGNQINKGANTLVIFCDVEGGLDDIGNIDKDPQFIDAENDDYHLKPTSPCINAGNPAAQYNDIDGSRNDMGAYGGPLGGWAQAAETPIVQDCVKGDVNGDGLIKSIDASLALRIAAGLLAEPSEEQRCAADMNNDGLIKSIDASLILRKAAGLEVPAAPPAIVRLNRQAGDRTLTVGSATGQPGDTIIIPIELDDATDVLAADLTLTYDASLLTFENAALTDLTAGFQHAINSAIAGTLIIPLSAREPLSGGSGALLTVTFRIKTGALHGQKGKIQLTEALLWNLNSEQIPTQTVDGEIAVTTPIETVTRTVSVGATSGKAGETVSLLVTIDDAKELLSVDLTVTYNPEVLTFQEAKTVGVTAGFQYEINAEEAGKLVIPLSGEQSIADGGGEIVELTFVIAQNAPAGETPIELSEALLWDANAAPIPSQTVAGKITVTTQPVETRNISVSKPIAPAGDATAVAIIVDDATGLISADLTLTYDAKVLTFQGVVTTELSDGFQYEVNAEEPGTLIIPLSAQAPLESGTGALLRIVFFVNPDAQIGQEIPIELTEALLWDVEGKQFISQITSGSVTVGEGKGFQSATGTFTIPLAKGLNNISLPVRPETPLAARAFAEMIQATVVWRLDTGAGEFVSFVPEVNTGAGFEIEGGKGYIVNVMDAKEIAFTGTVWDNALTSPPAPLLRGEGSKTPPSLVGKGAGGLGKVWAFVVVGRLDWTQRRIPNEITVINHRTGQLARQRLTPNADTFAVSFVDMSQRPVVEAGDRLGIRFTDSDGRPIFEPIELAVEPRDLRRAVHIVSPRYRPIPTQTRLLQNYPNPFNPETWIPYDLEADSPVSIQIYELRGHLVRRIDLGQQPAGSYRTQERAAYWDGRSEIGERVSSGVYFIQMKAGDFVGVRRSVILK